MEPTDWINPKDALPKQDQVVAVVIYHYKLDDARSCSIFIGEADHETTIDGYKRCTVETNDNTGHGATAVALLHEQDWIEKGACWTDVSNLKLPEWIFK